MARTLDPAAHAVKRDTFLDAAQRLIKTKGYEALSVQDVLAAVGTSKGAFYHYFDSKAALLDGGRSPGWSRRPWPSVAADRWRIPICRPREARALLRGHRPLQDRAHASCSWR